MQLTTIFATLLAAVNVHAAPSNDLTTRQTIPYNFALTNDNLGCTTRFSSAFPFNSPECQVLSTPAVGAFTTTNLPAGCTVTLYPNAACTGTVTISVPATAGSGCLSFGNHAKITALKVAGTCPGFQSH